MKKPAVYLLANKPFGTIYTGTTSALEVRTFQHKSGRGSFFTKKYGCTMLVYYHFFERMMDAIEAEKKIKDRSRAYKIQLIMSQNPEWKDLTQCPLY